MRKVISDDRLAQLVSEAVRDHSMTRMDLEITLRAQGYHFASLRLVPSVQRCGAKYGVQVRHDGHRTRFERCEPSNGHDLNPVPISADLGAALELVSESLPRGMRATVTITLAGKEDQC